MKNYRYAALALACVLVNFDARASDCEIFKSVFDERNSDFVALRGAFDKDIGLYRSNIKLPGADVCSIEFYNEKDSSYRKFSCDWKFLESASEMISVYRDDLINSVVQCVPRELLKRKPLYRESETSKFPIFSQRLSDDFTIYVRYSEHKNKYKGSVALILSFVLEKVEVE